MDGNLAINSHFENMSEKDMDDMHDHFKKEPIPSSFEKWIDDWVFKNIVSRPDDGEIHNAKVVWSRAIAIDAYRYLSQQKGASGHDMIDAIRRHTDELIAKGPEACRKFLKDAGIIGQDSSIGLQPIENEKIKRAMVSGIWVAIEHFQEAAKEDSGQLSYNEVESELYDVMRKIDPREEYGDIAEFPKLSTPEAQPINGEQMPEWVESTTPPEKEGFYNVITFENILIVTCYRYGRWEYDMEAGGSDAPDWVVRYRPSSYQPLSAREAQHIADSKEVPEEISQWIGNWIGHQIFDGKNGMYIAAKGMTEMYHKMQQDKAAVLDIWKDWAENGTKKLRDVKAQLADAEIQISKLLEELKEAKSGSAFRWVLPPKDEHKDFYTYYLIEFKDCGIDDYDYTICETLEEIGDQLQIAETSFDDDTIEAQAIITGIALTKDELSHWKEFLELPDRFDAIHEIPADATYTSELPAKNFTIENLNGIIKGSGDKD